MALGSNFPPMAWIVRLPGLDMLRVPPRVLFVTGFSFAVLAGYGLEALICRKTTSADLEEKPPAWKNFIGPLVFAVTAFVVLLGAAAWFVVAQPLTRAQFAWGAAALLISAAVVLLARSGRLKFRSSVVLIFLVTLVDILALNAVSLDFRPATKVISQGQSAAKFLREREGDTLFRVYSPSYSISQQTAAFYRLELADGVDPMQLDAYATFMQSATGVNVPGYSVTLPAFINANTAEDNKDARPDLSKLGLLNVKYIVSEFDIPESRLELLQQFGSTRIYENPLALPRAWVQPINVTPGAQILSEPDIRQDGNAQDLKAQGPGLLVLSEINYPGWRVWIDGAPAQIQTVDGILRGVALSAGNHSVRFEFRPTIVLAGCALALVGWAAMLVLLLSRRNPHG
jgi:hypothetical protein